MFLIVSKNQLSIIEKALKIARDKEEVEYGKTGYCLQYEEVLEEINKQK